MTWKDYNREYNRRYYAPGTSNRENRRIRDRERKGQHRESILDLYGRMCVKCGYSQDTKALQLDHINSNPRKTHRYARSGDNLYVLVLNGKLSKELFQLLCANCNTIKRINTPAENSARKDKKE